MADVRRKPLPVNAAESAWVARLRVLRPHPSAVRHADGCSTPDDPLRLTKVEAAPPTYSTTWCLFACASCTATIRVYLPKRETS